MNKTLKTQLNNLTLEQLFIIAQELDNLFWTYEDLKDYAIDLIKDDNILLATHILHALNDDQQEYYNYDVGMGTLDSVTPITTIKDFIDYLVNYNDEDIEEVLEKYQGGF